MTVFWDNDGVLVDTERLFFQATQEALARAGIAFEREQFIEISLKKGASAFDLALRRGWSEAAVDELRAFRNDRYGTLLSETRCVLDGVEEVLSALQGRHNMAVVTSSRRDHFQIIHAHSGLLKYFDFALTLEDYPRAKPHPDPYLAALKKANCTAAASVAIEDSERGLASALAAGLPCIIVPNELTRSGAFRGAYKVLERIHDVPEALAEWESAVKSD